MTTSTFYPVTLSNYWHLTGNREEVEPLIETALGAIHWLDQYGDLDGDGFYEYKTRSKQGVKNQGWKDSGDAIVYEDGSQVQPPIATCEEQGFAYMAKVRMAELLSSFGRADEAQRLFQEATDLKQRFNEAFWMPDEGFDAMGLDSDNRQIRAIGSNPGHYIATAIVEDQLVEETCQRLFADDMFTGGGIRTLSSENPAYKPLQLPPRQRVAGRTRNIRSGLLPLRPARSGRADYTGTVRSSQPVRLHPPARSVQ